MSIFRKENGSLVKKAGAAFADLTLNADSTNAVSNKAVTAAITQLNNDLTEKVNFPDMSDDIHTMTNETFVTPKDCWIIGAFYTPSSGGNATLYLNDELIATAYTASGGAYYSYANVQLPAKAGDTIKLVNSSTTSTLKVKLYGMVS